MSQHKASSYFGGNLVLHFVQTAFWATPLCWQFGDFISKSQLNIWSKLEAIMEQCFKSK